MIKEIKMPSLGTTSDEMKIVKWHKKPNDQVMRGEILFEVETDKAVMEVESYLAGFMKRLVVEEGGTVATGEVVALIGDETDVAYQQREETREEENIEAVSTAKMKAHSIRISPMVKKIAEKLGVDYTKVQGTGNDGMITKADIERAAAAAEPSAQRIEPFDRIGRATAKAMTLSKTTIPHVYFTVEVNAASMIALRNSSGKTISYNTMIIAAVSDGIRNCPYLAAKYSDEGRIMADKINIGLAVARENDLLVPVITDVDSAHGYEEIERKVRAQVAKVKDNTLQQSDMSGGVFTITNLGGYGIDSFSAVINPPEVAILAVGRMAERTVVVDGGIRIAPMMNLTLSVDHRVVNGAYAAEFLQTVKLILEGVGN